MVSVVKMLPIFLHLLALTKKNCVSVPASETVINEACTKLVESVAKFKKYLDPVKDVLPDATKLSELEDVTWLLPSTNETTKARTKEQPERLQTPISNGHFISR